MADQYIFDSIDYIIGPESKGFFGFALRTEGKLPGKTVSITYQSGSIVEKLEAPADIPKDSRILIFDDLIATGRSLRAARDLIESQECVIVDCLILREMVPLRSQAINKVGIPYKVLLQD
jgi:adenine phosphoribosyltransferase